MANRFGASLTESEPIPTGKHSFERLSHFNCGKCGGWWSIGDAPLDRAFCCTWCGAWQRFEDTTPKAGKGVG